MYFVFDTETSGLPKGRNPCFSDNDAYSSCRIVSIAWIVIDKDFNIENKGYFVVKPSPGCVISPGSIAIHGITNEKAHATGYSFSDVSKMMQNDLERCDTLVAHNISFDFGVLLHEFHQVQSNKLVHQMFMMKRVCTMMDGKKLLGVKKWPKLIELYAALFDGAQIQNAHNAMVDTEACADCFIKMNKPVVEAQDAESTTNEEIQQEAQGENVLLVDV